MASGKIPKINIGNTFGTLVDLSSYNSQTNQYTVPQNGYIRASCGPTTQAFTNVFVNNETILRAIGVTGGQAQYASVFVAKGMKVYYSKDSIEKYHSIHFIPLS